jgi:hypothetical protein
VCLDRSINVSGKPAFDTLLRIGGRLLRTGKALATEASALIFRERLERAVCFCDSERAASLSFWELENRGSSTDSKAGERKRGEEARPAPLVPLIISSFSFFSCLSLSLAMKAYILLFLSIR